MKIHIQNIPDKVIEYNAIEYVNEDGYVYCEIMGVM